MSNEVETLFSTAANGLAPAGDPKLEEIKWQVARGQMPAMAITPVSLATMSDEDEEWGTEAFRCLSSAGFIRTGTTSYTWARLESREVTLDFDVLSAIEAVVALRCGQMDLTRALPSLHWQGTKILQHAKAGEALHVCLETQRFFLALVAAMNASELLREYAMHARASLAYAWALRISAETLHEIGSTIASILQHLADCNGTEAAKSVTYLRKLQDEEKTESLS